MSAGYAARWWHRETERVVCDLCPRACRLSAGQRGFCYVRQATDAGMDLTTWGRSSGFCVDPVEKKPLFHFLPGTPTFSFGTAGCNLGCRFCQNWPTTKARAFDAGTDTADRDFALSLISNEQEALKEIADAIERMKKGSYGTCEITGKPIPAARLIAVPFTRYSLEGQKELERNRRAHRRRGGNPLGEIGDEVGFGSGGGGGEDEPSDS